MISKLEAHSVSLELPLFLQQVRSAKSAFKTFIGSAFDPPKREYRTILDDLSFVANEGDRVGILGRNGAGKSTLLRVLSGAFQPTRGRVEAIGSRQALLNISLGFNNEATIVENIYLRGTAMAMRTSQLRELVDPILEFAELTDKAGHRLKTLSSGQRLRLGFAIATSVQHDIMLMDEWIGTGDASFIHKARERMRGRVDGSKIVVLASHNASLLREVCNKGLILEGGRLLFFGDIESCLVQYNEILKRPAASSGG